MKINTKKWQWENQVNKQLANHEASLQQDLANYIRSKLDHGANEVSAKGVDIFGRTKEQVEMARLMRAGRKGIRVK